MQVLIVEDDHIWADWIQKALEKEFSELQLEINRISTEQEFRGWLKTLATPAPDVISMDMMLRWTDPTPEVEQESIPDDVKQGKFYRAGLRCTKLLAQDPKTRNVPVVLYTILERDDLEGELEDHNNVVHLSKNNDPRPLIRKIRDFLRQ
jgi:CheY-like chemotaxis protein